ncbi:TPA: hypothetical protein DCP77_01115 [Candidatus Collierbacteria bacterium]|uniref:Collagen-binding domain protein n=1 Tax=Candidatus Collierbacteria bacterium GW2011_GWA2_42_17 TaxID=1618378 RepID=A0A0G0Z1A6_9BACT|nr:MAG: Collagen-binding domain protein [Candidatus Collierbacteria bacterium GW2011_GWB2_42_12]KKS42544.1 MAG: Collagen-binding domain protein [Candidatus Collierbacteria bacterium GW2011_GWA2_42_17]KKS62125.1 MAG: Collagen-binding domain protein [Candidatus Collierbacteria bacterium GW2011_GWE2_42_48]KKS64323.1 MAG: Collagen-binding domain protein [Candidatus Collierbacteria bacterium GW2011_GWF2_42_51]KKS67114.1 MAG: Collagen-binding domain protein [Candidatus Collierbacteria bacterium GW201
MRRTAIKLLFFVVLLFISGKSSFAIDPNATGSAVVTAEIISQEFNPSTLISPSDNSTTNNPREALVWKRPSPLPATPLHHYDVYLDGQVFAASVSDSITSQVYYYYTIRRDNDTFYLDTNFDFAQGYHTWKVVAYTTAGTSASSETRTFYIDSIYPFITLKKVDRQTLNWSTTDLTTIPDINQRDLTVTAVNPLLTGSVEPYANMQFILICPQNILNCTNQIYQGNYPTGSWQHRFYGLIRGLVYTVYLSATDAGGNSTIFPEFYLAYGIISPTPLAVTTPTPTTSVSPEVTPIITPEVEITPVPFIPVPPISPTPPLNPTLVPKLPLITSNLWFMLLLVLGLPLHLLMTMYGAKIRLILIFRFISVLLFPFFGKKEYQTVPFATLDMYDPEKLDSSWQTKISDIKGFYHLTTPLLPKIFVKITATNRYWKNIIINCSLLSLTCLFPLPEDPKIHPNRLRKLSLNLRSLPLTVACLTSTIAFITQQNYFFLIYLYLSLQLAYSEYLYPKISR